MSRKSLGWCLFVWSALCGIVYAQDKPLKITIRREWEGARTSAPLSLRAFVKWQKPELLEGRLQVRAFVDGTPISDWISHDTALSESEQVIWFMTPRPVILNKLDRYVLEAEFLGEKRSFDPEQLDVEAPIRGRRTMVVAVVIDHGSTTPTGLGAEGAPTAFEFPFTLQQHLSAEEGADLHVHLSRVKPAEFPADSLRLLGLDAIVLAHDNLNQLRSAQREAIRVWVQAGGSLTLLQLGKLQPESAEFVQVLSQNEWSQSTRTASGLPDSVNVFGPGMGQFIVAHRELPGDSREWARVARQAIQMLPERSKSLEESHTLSLGSGDPLQSYRQLAYGQQPLPMNFWNPGTRPLEPRPRVPIQELTQQLMPDSIRGMPFGLAASVLACCLFCIAPGDYLLLGLLKRRKWTWAVFPLVALGFTGWMAHLAAEHNGRNDSRTWISIVDVSPQNEVLRTSRLELTYGASGRAVAHAVQGQWWTDMREDDLVSRMNPAEGINPSLFQTQRSPSQQELGDRLSYHGSVPANYIVEEPVRQWAPRLQRITTLGADPDLKDYPLPQIDWNAIPAQEWVKPGPALQQAITKTWPHAQWMARGPVSRTEWASRQSLDPVNPRKQAVLGMISGLTGVLSNEDSGVFTLFTELAPTAAPDCEDLVLRSRPSVLIMNEVEPGRYLVLRVVFPVDAAMTDAEAAGSR